MPIPKPHKDEEKDKFVGRCMADEIMNSEYPDDKQRAAICYKQWEDKDKESKRDLPVDRLVRSFTSELRFSEPGRTVEGYAILYNTLSESLGNYKERLLPGACKGSLGRDIRLLFNHDESKVLARTKSNTLQLIEDERGVKFVAALPKWAGDIAESISRGDVTGCSFRFLRSDYLSAKWSNENGERVASLPKVTVEEISIVPFPAYPQTTVQVRSIQTDSGESLVIDNLYLYDLRSQSLQEIVKPDFKKLDELKLLWRIKRYE